MPQISNLLPLKPLRLLTVCLIITLTGCDAQDDDSEGSGSLTSPTVPSDTTTTGAATTDGSSTVSETSSDQALTDSDPAVTEETEETDKVAENYFYFSYDDSASTASHNLAMYGLDNDVLPVPSLGKPYEFLNAETFTHFQSEEHLPFTISMGVLKTQTEVESGELSHDYHFGAYVSGPEITNEERKNVVLTLLVDVSGSMTSSYSQFIVQDENTRSLLDVVKHGLTQLSDMLKPGDVVNLVTFSSSASITLGNWQHGDNLSTLLTAIDTLSTKGSTNLNAGIELAYDIAQQTYDQTKANRVVILTDAYANTGQVDVTIINQNTVINELEGIHFSGIGIGDDFNHTFLNELTDAGKGSYFSMVTPQDAERIFTTGLPSLIDVAVEDVIFKLTFPESLSRTLSAAEESSTDKADIQSTNFSYITGQFFIESFNAPEPISEEGSFTLGVEYLDPESGETITVELTQDIGTLVQKGQIQIMEAMFVRGLALLIGGGLTCDQVEEYRTFALGFESEKIESYQAKIDTFCESSN